MEKLYLSKKGYEKIRKDLEELKKKRPLIAKAIGEARDYGDISENAEYDAAKDEQGLNELKISELEDKIGRAVVIDESRIPKDEVLIGARVTLKDLDSGEDVVYTLVSQVESDFSQGKISIESPVGKGLLNHKVGQVADISVPVGKLKYKIIKIERE